MAPTLSSHVESSILQPVNQYDSSLLIPRHRPSSALYYSSYGESEPTPTPSTPKSCKALHLDSRPGFDSGPSNPTFKKTPPSAQVPRDFPMEDSGDESDEVYDEFDLGDFTKEEIKAYESMVGPGERLRDAAPPKKTLAEMLEASYRKNLTPSDQNVERSPAVTTLPEELYELVRAGISNGIERAISKDYINIYCESAEELVAVLMHEIREPFPQINDFIQKHEFTSFLFSKKQYRRQDLQGYYQSSGSLKAEQRQYEQDVYDFSRDLGLSVKEAEKWMLKAREYFSEKDYGSTDTENSDIANSSDEMLDQSFGLSSPEKFRLPWMPVEHSDQAPYDPSSPDSPANLLPESVSMSGSGLSQALALEGVSTNSKDAMEDVGQNTAKSKIKSAEQLQQCQLQTFKDPDRRSEDPKVQPTTRTLPDPDDERPVDKVINDGRDTNEIERVVNEKEDKAAKKAVKNARKANLKAEKEAKRQLEKKKSRDGKHEHTDSPEGQLKMISSSEELSQSERLEDKRKPQKQKKKGRKRKVDLDVLPQSDVQSGEHHKHKKSRVDSDAQGDVSIKIKRKKTGPQSSPFFKRSSGIKAKRKDEKKAEPKTDFSSPMIQ